MLQDLPHLLLLLLWGRLQGPRGLHEVTRQLRIKERYLRQGCFVIQFRPHHTVLLQLHPLLQSPLSIHLLHQLDALPLLLLP